MALLEVRNLSFTYRGKACETLHKLSFSVESGEYVAVSGPTGSGKSTLLRMLKREITPIGDMTGEILLNGKLFGELTDRAAAQRIGYVMQRPEQQIVTDKVWHELAFGLENLGVPQTQIRRRVAEIAAYFNMEDWFDQRCDTLSGGQKQLLNLAAVMVMQPEILILDEPTAQLDPIAATAFLDTVKKLNRDTGLTVIVAEHRLEEVLPVCDRLLVLKKGSLCAFGSPETVLTGLRGETELMEAMPAVVRLANRFGKGEACPLTVPEGRSWLRANFDNRIDALPPRPAERETAPALQVKGLRFRYERNLPDVLRDTELTVRQGEIVALLGGNGSGKSTLLSCIAGLKKPYAGKISVFEKPLSAYPNRSLYKNCLTLLTQDVQTMFLHDTVREELKETGIKPEDFPYDLTPLLDSHPYDLSGGEQQLLALAKVMAAKPRLLLMDEPTKGLDNHARARFIDILRTLRESGVTFLIVTHDVDLAAELADRCALFFRGEVIDSGDPESFFDENRFYTTAVNRITRGYYRRAVTLEAAAALCEQNGGAKCR